MPPCKPNGSNDADLTHRVRSLEQQMNEVLSMKLSYANVANPPAPMQNTPKRVVPGQSIPVTDPHYLPPGSLITTTTTKKAAPGSLSRSIKIIIIIIFI